jgi:mRNA-degrading endonuclease HigB of HigAB toxin-antitoxin module
MWPKHMNVIGAPVLLDYADAHPEAAAPLKALHALIREADWAARPALETQFQAIARFGDGGGVTLRLDEPRIRVVLNVNYGIGLVRIVSVSSLDETGR